MKNVKKAKKDSKYIDLLVSGCKFRTECFKRNFWYNGEIAEVGTPRNDVLFSEEKDLIAKATKKELGIEENKPLVIKTPIGTENITVNSIDHIVKGGGDSHPPDKTRFKSINKMLETLKTPFLVNEKDDKRYYFKVFKSQEDETKNDMVIISPEDEVYTNFPIDRGSWFYKQITKGKIIYDILDQ